MRILSLCLLAIALLGCNSPDTQSSRNNATNELPAKLYKNIAELEKQPFIDVGSVSGASCQMTIQDPPPEITSARQDMLLRASRMNANAVILDNCEITGNIPGCYRQAVCLGSAITVTSQ